VIVIGPGRARRALPFRDIGVRFALGPSKGNVLRQIIGNDALVWLLGLMNAIPNDRIQ
jgi:hypothetical protein